jgi:hypothetical protein
VGSIGRRVPLINSAATVSKLTGGSSGPVPAPLGFAALSFAAAAPTSAASTPKTCGDLERPPLPAPATAFNGKGVLPGDYPKAFGAVGFMSHDYVSFGFDEADVLVILATSSISDPFSSSGGSVDHSVIAR